jgi:2-amino-4-hydroxy-6-hydroxymethyldihydropteridine diphosphokinase
VNFNEAAIVAIGSNLGDSVAIVRSAMDRLRSLTDGPIIVSSLYQTKPVDCPPGSPPFTNAVVAFKPRTAETATSLLARLQAMEKEFGRQRSGKRNEARTLDLDLIAFGAHVVAEAALTLPHPRAQQRAFVLGPLSEIAPDYILPGQKETARVLAAKLGVPSMAVRRLAE